MNTVMVGKVECLEVTIEGRLQPLRLGRGVVSVFNPEPSSPLVVSAKEVANHFVGMTASFEVCRDQAAALVRRLRLYGGRTTYRNWTTKDAQRFARRKGHR